MALRELALDEPLDQWREVPGVGRVAIDPFIPVSQRAEIEKRLGLTTGSRIRELSPDEPLDAPYQPIGKEHPVSYRGTVRPTNVIPSEDIFRTGIEEVSQAVTPARSLERGPISKGIEFGLGALSRLAPTGMTEPVIAETVGQIKEGEEGMTGRIMRESGFFSPTMARSIGDSIPARAADLLFSGVTALTPKAITDAISGVVNKAEELSPGSGKMIERLMFVAPLIRIGGTTKLGGIKSTETLVSPRNFIEAAQMRMAVREKAGIEPAFVEELKKTREEPPTLHAETVPPITDEVKAAPPKVRELRLDEPIDLMEVVVPKAEAVKSTTPPPELRAKVTETVPKKKRATRTDINFMLDGIAQETNLDSLDLIIRTEKNQTVKKAAKKRQADLRAQLTSEVVGEAPIEEALKPTLEPERTIGPEDREAFIQKQMESLRVSKAYAGFRDEDLRVVAEQTLPRKVRTISKVEAPKEPDISLTKEMGISLADARRIAKRFPLIRNVTETAKGFEPQFDAGVALAKTQEVIAQRTAFKAALKEKILPPRVEPTEAGMQGVLSETPQRTTPTTSLKPKVTQTEKMTELEKGTDISQMSFTDLAKRGFGSETGAIGKLTPEQIAREAEARAARKEIYRRISEAAAKTGETLEAIAERMKLPPGALIRLQAEQEAAPVGGFTTSIKNAAVDEELAKMGLPPATHGQRMSFEEARVAAAQKMQDDPFAGQKLVNELVGKERPVTAIEDALLLHEQTRLKNERIHAEDQFIAAQKSGDQNAINQTKARVDAVTADFMTIGDIVTKVGTESSLSLGHRRMMMKEDYSLAAMERAEQVSKGRPLTEGERAEVKALHEKINATEKSLIDYMLGAKAREAEAASKIAHLELLTKAAQEPTIQIDPRIRSLAERIVISMEREAETASIRLRAKLSRLSVGVDPTIISDAAIIGAAKIARAGLDFGKWSEAMAKDFGEKIKPYLQAIWEASNKRLDERIVKMAGKSIEPVKRVIKKADVTEQRAAVKDQIRAKVEGAEEENISLLTQRLARTFVEQGIKERNALIDAVHSELKDILPDITRRETMDAISGYGKYKQLSKDEVSVLLRDLKGQMQQVAKLEDIQAKEPPLKTGIERRIPSDEERRLIQQVNEAKRRFGVVVADPATQLQSALGAIKTRLKNSIADLKYQIANRVKIIREKTGTAYDTEALKLKAEQDALRDEFSRIFGKPEITDAQRVKAAIAATERSIADLEQRIKVGDIGPRTRLSKTPTTPELEAARARRDALKEQLEELRDLARPKKTPEQIALQSLKTRLANNTADLLDRMARGDFTKKPKREVKLDPEAIKLQAENVKAKEQFHQRQRANELANRSRWQKALDTFVKWERNFKLSSPVVFGKLTAAAMTRMVTTATEEVVGGVLSKLPGIRTVAAQAPREGGLNLRAMAKGFVASITKGMEDAWQTGKTGTSHLDILYGKKLYDADWANFFGQLHGMMKAPIKRGEFTLSLEKRTEYAIRNGVDVTDPLVQTQLATQALDDGYRSIFMQHGFSSDMFNNFVRMLETSKKYPIAGEISARMLRFLMPIVRVPSNIVAETATGVHGAFTASARTMFHAINGTLKTLPPEVNDSIMRQFKKGSIGLGLMAVGYFNSENIGGYDWREKRKLGAVKFGGYQIGGTDIPRWMTHAPWFELMQIGATVKHVKDQHIKGEERGIGEGLWAAGLGLIEETPFIGEMLRVDKLFGRPHERSAYLGELGRSTVIPQAVQWAAKQMDRDAMGEVIKRKPRNILEHFKMGIPGMREDVPKARSRGSVGESRTMNFSELIGRIRRSENVDDLLRSGRVSSQDLRLALEDQ